MANQIIDNITSLKVISNNGKDINLYDKSTLSVRAVNGNIEILQNNSTIHTFSYSSIYLPTSTGLSNLINQVEAMLYNSTGDVYSDPSDNATTTTSKEILKTYDLEGGKWKDWEQLKVTGYLRTAANGNAKTAYVAFGATEFTIAATQNDYFVWFELIVTRLDDDNQIMRFQSRVKADSTTLATAVQSATKSGTEDLTQDITIKVSGLTPTAAGDLTAKNLIIKKI